MNTTVKSLLAVTAALASLPAFGFGVNIERGAYQVSPGGEFVALIPTRYPFTHISPNPAAKLARATEWVDAGAETFVGTGQRLLATDAGDVALMDLRVLRMDALPDAA